LRILISDSAYVDIKAIKEYYIDEGVPHIGEQFISSIIEHIETLPANPDIGRKVAEFNTKKIRELIHNPFRIIYLREEQSVHVVRVWRSERLLKLQDTRYTRKKRNITRQFNTDSFFIGQNRPIQNEPVNCDVMC